MINRTTTAAATDAHCIFPRVYYVLAEKASRYTPRVVENIYTRYIWFYIVFNAFLSPLFSYKNTFLKFFKIYEIL
jgi:hypothetical protein